MTTLYGGKHVADHLGVSPQTLQNWRRRYTDTPAPNYEVVDGMPLWDSRGLAAWTLWVARKWPKGRAA